MTRVGRGTRFALSGTPPGVLDHDTDRLHCYDDDICNLNCDAMYCTAVGMRKIVLYKDNEDCCEAWNLNWSRSLHVGMAVLVLRERGVKFSLRLHTRHKTNTRPPGHRILVSLSADAMR